MSKFRRIKEFLEFIDTRAKVILFASSILCVLFTIKLATSLVSLDITCILESLGLLLVTVSTTYIFLKAYRELYFTARIVKKLSYDYYPFSSINNLSKFILRNFYSILRKLKLLQNQNSEMMSMINEVDGVGIVVIDEQKYILIYNKFAERTFNLSQDYRGKRFYSLFPFPPHKMEELSENNPIEIDVPVNSEVRTFKMFLRNLNSKTLIYFFDVTEVKNLEKIADLSLSIFSHELNTPLTNLYLALENTLLSGKVSEEVVNISLSNIRRISNTISNIINLSNFYSNKVRVSHQRFNLKRTINNILEEIYPPYKDKKLKIKFTYRGEEEIVGDRDKIHLILFNLIDNAMKFSPDGSEVKVNVSNTGKTEISVSNRTTQPLGDELGKIFDKFYRGINSLGQRGSGLGLHIVKLLCDVIGAKVEAFEKGNVIIFRVSKE